MKSIHCLVGFAGVVALAASPVLADGRTDYYYQYNQQRYFDMPQNAESLGMGGASVPTLSGSASVIGNPAGLGFMKDADVSVSYGYNQLTGNDLATFEDIEQETHAGHVLAALPIMPTLDGTPEWGNLGFGWSGYRGDANDLGDTDTDGYRLHAAYGNDLNDRWSLGYSVSYHHDSTDSDVLGLYTDMDNGVRQAVGFIFRPEAGTSFGLSTSYGMGTQTYDRSGIELDDDISSWGIAFGGSYAVTPQGTVAWAIDYDNYNSDLGDDTYSWGFRTGYEHAVMENWKARVGYRYQANFDYDLIGADDNAKFNAVSFGTGVNLGSHLRADYGAEYRWVGQGDWTHLVTLSVPFSLCVNDK